MSNIIEWRRQTPNRKATPVKKMHWGDIWGDVMVALCGYSRALPVRTYNVPPPVTEVCQECAVLAREAAGF